MKLISFLTLIFLISTFEVIKQSNSETAYQRIVPTALKNFVESLSTRTHLVLFLCYRADILVQIMRDVQVPVKFKKLGPLNINDYSLKHTTLFVVDLGCPRIFEFLEDQLEDVFYKHPFRWLLFHKIGGRLPKINCFVDSNIFLASFNAHNEKPTTFIINQIYQLDRNSSYIFESYAEWTFLKGIELFQREKVISKRRRNLHRRVLTSSIVITHNDTLHHLDDYKDKHVDSVTKVNFVITKHLIECLNATMKYIVVPTWGYPDRKTGDWNGMIKTMIEKKADIGGTVLFITTERMAVIEYISSTSPTLVQFILREPPLSFVRNIYVLPFTNLVWTMTGLLIALAFAIFFITMKFQNKITNNYFIHTQDVLFSAIPVICQMGTRIEAKIVSARIAIIFLSVTLIFLYTSYTANIVALLQSTSHSIQTLTDILKSDLEVGVDDTPFNRYFFESATEPVRKAIYETKVLTKKGKSHFMNITEGVARLRKGLFALHVELDVGYKIIEETFFEHEKCNLKTIQFIEGTVPWYSIQKGSPYKEMLKVNVFKIREYGIQNRENAKIYTKKPECSTHQQSFESVRLIDCYAPLQFLLIGYLLAIVIFIFENIFKFSKRNSITAKPIF